MNWQFGDEDLNPELPDTNDTSPPAHWATPTSRRASWLVLFLVALAASWTTGFYLGRVRETSAVLEAQIQGRLDVESWAWEQADWSLFRSLLPRRTPSWRLKALQAMFNATAPEKRDMTLVDYIVKENGGRVDAVVQVSAAGRQYEISRTYRLLDGRWQLVRLGEFDDRAGP